MISTLAYTENEQLALLRKTLKRLAAKLTEDYWTMVFASSVKELEEQVCKKPVIDLLCCEVTEETLQWLESFRKVYKQTKVMLIADESIPPVRYLRPHIMASSLLLKPYKAEQLDRVMEEFIRAFLEEQPDEEKSFVLKTKEGKIVIPYEQIYYLESRDKKLYIRTLNDEYAFYETLDKVTEKLPEYFLRSHRSFVINSHMLERVQLSENLLTLRDGFEIPLSRSYKSAVKGLLK